MYKNVQCVTMTNIYYRMQGRIQDFPLGGGGGANPHWRGCQPPTQALFGENICKNERIWSCWGGARWKLLYVDPPLVCDKKNPTTQHYNCNLSLALS